MTRMFLFVCSISITSTLSTIKASHRSIPDSRAKENRLHFSIKEGHAYPEIKGIGDHLCK
jgi:hypothetical protein